MKKTQILGVIALAFALGVVAPVSPAVFAEEGDTVVVCNGTSVDEVKEAIKNVTANPTYLSYKKLEEKLTEAAATSDVPTVQSALSGLYGAGNAIPGIATPRANATLEDVIKSATDFKIELTNVSGTNEYSYQLIADLVNAMDAAEDTAANNTVAASIRFTNLVNAAKALGFTDIETTLTTANASYTAATVVNADFGTTTGTPAAGSTTVIYTVKSAFASAISGTSLTDVSAPRSTAIVNLVRNTNNAKATLEAYNALRDALIALDPQAFGVSTYDNLEKAVASDAASATYGTISSLNGLASTASVQAIRDAWTSVDAKVASLQYIVDNFGRYGADTVCEALDHTATDTENFDGLLQLVNEGFRLTRQSAWTYAQLVSATPATDEPGTDEPGTDEPGSAVPADPSKPSVSGDGQGADGAADKAGAEFGTPDTGVVAKSEGSASTSVSIMAAISTVVAGLGAAVVAVRNYKRNKNA